MLFPFLIAIGLNFDTFSVAVVEGSKAVKPSLKKCLTVGTIFGLGQAFLAFAGYLFGLGFRVIIGNVDHWLAFVLLTAIGIKLIGESAKKEDCPPARRHLDFRSLLLLSLATSIDALAIGITFALLKQSVLTNVAIIFAVTFAVAFTGFRTGKVLRNLCNGQPKLVGGTLLVLIGFKILIEHLFFGG